MKSIAQAVNFKELNIILKNSFQAIKKDITGVHDQIAIALQQQELSMYDFSELRNGIDALKNNFVTLDKYNFLKISISGLKQEIQRIDSSEKSVEQSVGELRELIGECATKQQSEKAIDDLKKEIRAKNTGWKNSLQTIAKDVSSDFEKINRNFEAMEKNNEEAIGKKVDRFKIYFENKLAGKIDTIRSENAKLNKETAAQITNYQNDTANTVAKLQSVQSSAVKKEQAEKMLKQINSEFDCLKKAAESIGNAIENTNDEFDTIKKKVSSFSRIDSNMAILNSNFEELKNSAAIDFAAVRDDLDNFGEMKMKNLGNAVSNTKKAGLKAKAGLKLSSELKTETTKLMGIKLKTPQFIMISNLVIGLAFILLVISGILFFALAKQELYIMDWFMISAVIVFCIGIIIRIGSVFRKEKSK